VEDPEAAMDAQLDLDDMFKELPSDDSDELIPNPALHNEAAALDLPRSVLR
jgi:hypothetical protein